MKGLRISNEPEPRPTAGVTPPPVIFLAFLILGLALSSIHPVPILANRTPAYLAGGALIAIGVLLSAWVVIQFRRAGTAVSPMRPSRALVISGPYRFSRNPDYIGQSLIYVGLGFMLNSAWVLAGFVPALLIVRFAVVAREERYLTETFGPQYVSYCNRVRRWL